ncbi:MAG TPA: ATP-dependent DNA helicase [Candidatus Dormibacteraeota bacterium]|nr:ATP-dependent DNA helicase [Candidatus Dormibacteraeota bacterium]
MDLVAPELVGPTRLTGGPSSGKSWLLARCAADWIASGGSPRRLVIVTRSHAGVRQMSDRIEALLPDAHVPPVLLTHEGLAKLVLRETGQPERSIVAANGIAEWTAMSAALTQSLPLLDRLRPLAEDPGCIEDLLAFTSAVKQALVGPGLLAGRLLAEVGVLAELAVVVASYQGVLERMGARDSRDLVAEAVGALQTNSELLCEWADWLLVDEAEDLSPAQWHLIQQLGNRLSQPRRLLLAGDPRVALPALAGPSARSFEELFPQQMRPTEWVLEEGASSWGRWVAGALELQPSRLPPEALTVAAPGEVESTPASGRIWAASDETDEAFAIAREIQRARLAGEVSYDEVGILLWDQASQFGQIAEALRAIGVPFRSERQKWQGSVAVRVILLWLEALLAPGSDLAVLPILVEGPSSSEPAEVWKLRQEAARHQRSISDALLRLAASASDSSTAAPMVRLALLWQSVRNVVTGYRPAQLSGADFAALLSEIELGTGLSQLALGDGDTASAIANLSLAVDEAVETMERIGEPVATLSHWVRLLRVGMRRSGWTDEGAPAGGFPEVSVLSVLRSKGRQWRRVFLPGSVDGIVPDSRAKLGMLGFQETERLVELVPELEDVMTAPGQARERARSLVFTALTRSSEQITVSWVRRAGERDCQPSPVLAQLSAAGLAQGPAPSAFPVTRADCVALGAATCDRNTLADYSAEWPSFAEQTESLAACLEPWDPVAGSEALMRSDLSATSVRAWLACPRLHYYGLLRPRQTDSAPLVLGIAAHRLLEIAHSRALGSTKEVGSFISAAQEIVTQELMPEVRSRLVDHLLALFVELWLGQMIVRWANLIVGPDGTGTQLASEVRFRLDRGLLRLSGKVDALWRHHDGSLEVVDFKTSSSDLPTGPALARQLFGTEEEGPSDWQLPLYVMAARSGAFSELVGGDLPGLARNWYVGADPGRQTALVARGFRLGAPADAPSRGMYGLSWDQLDRLESELQKQAELILAGQFPAAPRHSGHTCRDHRGCPLESCCDGEGTVGAQVRVPGPKP